MTRYSPLSALLLTLATCAPPPLTPIVRRDVSVPSASSFPTREEGIRQLRDQAVRAAAESGDVSRVNSITIASEQLKIAASSLKTHSSGKSRRNLRSAIRELRRVLDAQKILPKLAQ